MKKRESRKKVLVWAGVCSAVLVASVCACAPMVNPGNPTPDFSQKVVAPETDEWGIVTAEAWKDIYPLQYDSYMLNASNTPRADEYLASEDTVSNLPEDYEYTDANKADYLADDMYPEIKILGAGYGYAKYYTEPASHLYSLWTVQNNGRVNENTKAGCITCKSPQFSADVDEQGDSIFQENFWDLVGQYTESISCASCHGNDPTQLEVDRAGWTKAMGDDADDASLEGQVCGQCHCDYSMDPVTAVPTSPYDNGREDMTPDKMLKWYDEHNYVDWTYETTGAQMIAVRHAEYEFNYGGEGNHMTDLGYDCNDCHMATTYSEDGTAYTNHNWISPLDNDELIERDCSTCHADLKAEVAAWQEDTDGRTHVLGVRAAKFITNFEDAINNGSITDEQKADLQYIQRAACFYWNLAAAENSEGAHNPELYNECIDKGNAQLDKGDKILGVSSVASE